MLDVQGTADFMGNVGIGTTTPGPNNLQINPTFEPAGGYGLVVCKPNYAANVQLNSSAGQLGIGLALDNVANGDINTSMLLIRNNMATNGQTLMNLTADGTAFFSGNVGIGSTSPQRLLQVGDVTVLGSQGLIRLASRGNGGTASRLWDFGVPIDANNPLDTAGQNYSFVIKDTATTVPAFVIRWDTQFVGIGTTNPLAALDVAGEINSTALNITSDRNAKEHFQTVNPREVLAKVSALPITEWQYKADKANNASSRHIGPMAQDFSAAFALGQDDKHISVVDEGGVALAAIQGLNEKVDERDARIREQEIQIQTQTVEIRKLSQALADLQTTVGQMQQNIQKSKAE